MKDARPITGGLLAAAAMIATGYTSYPEVKDVDGDSSPSHRKKRSKSSHKQNARKMQKRKK